MTGDVKRFYSKLLGRKDDYLSEIDGKTVVDFQYTETGELGFIGLIHGFAIRSFPVSVY